MGKTFNHGNRKKEKGITLVETIVSLSIISIISLATVTLAIYSTNSLRLSRERNFFIRETYNFANLYLSYDEEKFIDAINWTTNLSEAKTYHNFSVYYDVNHLYTDETHEAFYVSLEFTDENKTLNLSAYSIEGKILHTRSVSK